MSHDASAGQESAPETYPSGIPKPPPADVKGDTEVMIVTGMSGAGRTRVAASLGDLGWFVVGASIFASNIGSEHLVGLAGSGATDGVTLAHFELHAWCLLVLGWVMIPFYMRSGVFTMPEFLERRFSPAARRITS